MPDLVNKRILKQWRFKKLDDGNIGSVFLVGHAYGLKGYPDGTKVETGKVIFRSRDGKSVVLEGGKVWELETINEKATPSEKAFTEESLRKLDAKDFTVGDNGRVIISAAGSSAASPPSTPDNENDEDFRVTDDD